VISRFAVIGDFVPRLPFNPVELFEEPQRLLLTLRASTKRRLEWAMHPRWVAPASVRQAV
jgi:hypothetical protein